MVQTITLVHIMLVCRSPLSRDPVRPWSEHRSDEAHHRGERNVRKRQIFGIPLLDTNVQSFSSGSLPGLIHQVLGQIQTGHIDPYLLRV